MEKRLRLLFILLLTQLGIALLVGFYKWHGFNYLKEHISLLNMFQLERFDSLGPFLWYLIFALSLSLICEIEHGKFIAVTCILFQLYYVLINNNDSCNQLQHNLKAAYHKIKGEHLQHGYYDLTFKEYFSENLYKEIKDYIAVPQKDYRVVSIGLYPNIANFNGFYTLDGYIANYPLEYKHQFRKIIEKELNKSERWRKYFDYWGSRCYVFVSELDKGWFENKKDNHNKINNLDLNTAQLKAMGGKYIFSALEIVNADQNQLALLKIFERDDSPWRVYLYRVL
jgi:hypothetical protein